MQKVDVLKVDVAPAAEVDMLAQHALSQAAGAPWHLLKVDVLKAAEVDVAAWSARGGRVVQLSALPGAPDG